MRILGVDHLRAPRRRRDMAVPARLIALSADIDLQRAEPAPPKPELVFGEFRVEAVHSDV
jgi:hypothetical protein